ncbi:hypothetical protein C8J56DRAFT_771156, partial [Mycena floridula]
ANILMHNDCHCCLMDFRLAFVVFHNDFKGNRGSTSWFAPEYLSDQPTRPHPSRDVYAYGGGSS